MFRPHIPVNPAPTHLVPRLVERTAVTPVHDRPTSPCACTHPAHVAPLPSRAPGPSVRLTGTGLAVALAGGTAIVLVVGAVLVSMLLAVAITGVSVTVCAVVLRSLFNTERNQH
ncbi:MULTISPECIES: SpdD-like protein [unclassified Streptomyces]|uniref:SpdD-like protein n=1 Tax=unclassified Streptomyces TaxID=2593676 RepID=UPI0037FBC8BA